MAEQKTNFDKELGELRDGIDAIDAQVLRLLSERARFAQRVGAIKQGGAYGYRRRLDRKKMIDGMTWVFVRALKK
jgi:chorismate mutase